MPTRTKYRIWCKTCQEFMFHSEIEKDVDERRFSCDSCDTVYTDIFLKDISEEKLQEQRKRYQEKHKKDMEKMFGNLLESPEQRRIKELIHMFSPPGTAKLEVYESDAGQKQIDEAIRKKRMEELEGRRKIRDEQRAEAAKYTKLGRNDACICGSGLKYKKCCLSRIKSYK